MNIFEDTHPQTLTPSVATIGFFDGVHLGHRYLINQVKIAASQCGWCSSIITFPIHPRQVIQSDYQPQLLSSPEEKLKLLASTGVDHCILLPFTRELSMLTAREFMQLLYDKYKVRMLVIGYDHRFGHNRAEVFEDYCRYGRELGIHIMQATAYTQEQDKVSSSAIRRALLSGDVSTARKYLGYNYFLEGTLLSVVVGIVAHRHILHKILLRVPRAKFPDDITVKRLEIIVFHFHFQQLLFQPLYFLLGIIKHTPTSLGLLIVP